MFALLHWAADAKDVAFGAATISDDVNLAKKEWTGGNLYVKGDEVIFFIDKWLKYVNRAITGSVWRALHRHVRSIHHQNGSRLKVSTVFYLLLLHTTLECLESMISTNG